MVLSLLCSSAAFAALKPTDRLMEQLHDAIVQCRELSKQALPYDAVFSRDPMVPLVDEQGRTSSARAGSGPAVQGIIWSEEHPLAVVDGELLKPGDTVGPYTLIEIRPDGLVAGRDGQSLFVPLDRGLAASPDSPPSSTDSR